MANNPLDKPFCAETRTQWRAWLRKHHRKEAFVWLVFYKKHTEKKCVDYDAAVEEALCYGWIDGIKKRIDDDRYAFRFSPRSPKSLWSASNKKRVEKLTAAGKMTKAGTALVDAAKESGMWDRKPAAEQTFEMPSELTAALAKNKTAKKKFEAQSAACRKQYITWIASAKKPETRERRAAQAVQMLKEDAKPGTM